MPKLPMRHELNQNHVLDPPSAQLPSRPKVDGRRHSLNKGKGKGKGIANPDSGPDSEDDEDAYVIKTNHLNGTLNGGKGKRKVFDEFLDDADEDLYS
jgi:hypothetical protein